MSARADVHGKSRVAGDTNLSGMVDVDSCVRGLENPIHFDLNADAREKAARTADITHFNNRVPFKLPDVWI